MPKLVPIIAGITGTAVIGSAGGYLISTQNTKTFKEKFKVAIIDFDNEKELVNSKLKKLKDAKNITNESRFKSAFDKEQQAANSGFEELKKICKEIYNSSFTDKKAEIFKDFQSYCARTIKDKIKDTEWATETAQWKTRFDKLKQTDKKALSKELIDMTSGESADETKLKQWCLDTAEIVFEGEEDLIFKDANISCRKND